MTRQEVAEGRIKLASVCAVVAAGHAPKVKRRRICVNTGPVMHIFIQLVFHSHDAHMNATKSHLSQV